MAGVEIILRLLDDMEEIRKDMENQFDEYRLEAERRLLDLASQSNLPVRRDEQLLPTPRIRWKKTEL